MKRYATIRVVALAMLMAAAQAYAQRHGGMGGGGMHGPGPMGMPGGGGPGPMRMPHDGSGVPGGNVPHGGPAPNAGGSVRGGPQLGPPGRWWDDKKYARSLGLNNDQQKRMDAVFNQNRSALLSRFEALQAAQSRLQSLTHQSHPSESAVSAEIDNVAQARAELEKAYTHMQLQLREEMTPEQLGKLDEQQ